MHGDWTKLRRSLEFPERIVTPAKLAMSAAVLGGMMLLTAERPTAQDATDHRSAASEKPRPTTLHEAAAAGDLAELRRLLHFRPINERDGLGRTALHYAVEFGHAEIVRFLVAREADTRAGDEHGFIPVHLVADRDVLLALHPSDSPVYPSLVGWTQLHTAADVEIAEIELARHPSWLERRDKRQRTALDRAVERGRADLVRFFLKWNADFNPVDGERIPPLVLAAGRGDVEIVETLLAAGAPVDRRGRWGPTPLAAAARSGSEACVRLLLAAGADARLPSGEGRSVLAPAAAGGNLRSVRLLIAAGAAVQPADASRTDTPLLAAVGANQGAIVRELLRFGASVQGHYGNDAMVAAVGKSDSDIVAALLEAGVDPRGGLAETETLKKAVRHRRVRNVKLLLDAGVDPDGPGSVNGPYQDTAIQTAARFGSLEMVQALLAGGADPNRGRPLPAAIEENHTDVALALLAAGADPNVRNFRGHDPVLWDAVRKGNLAISRALLASGAKVRGSGSSVSSLPYAVSSRNPDLVRLLLEHGDDPNDTGADPVLNEAVAHDDVEIVRLLLDAGANPNAESEYGPDRPLYAAKSREMVRMLLAAGAEFKLAGYTPLHAAQTPEMVDEFIARGIDVNAPDDQCRTPLFSAAIDGRAEVVRRLLELGADARIACETGQSPRDFAKDPEVRRVLDEFAARFAR